MITTAPPRQVGRCPHNASSHCCDCRLGGICLPIALQAEEINRLDSIIHKRKGLPKGKHLFRSQDTFQSVYAISSGHLKTYKITEDGKEQVIGFHFPGEIIGLDGIGTNQHLTNAEVLDEAAVCEIPFKQFQTLTSELSALQLHFYKLMSKEIQTDQLLITLLSKKTAKERMATFLLMVSSRKARHFRCATRFSLPMPRSDIASYLGLTIETVSRILTRLSGESAIQFNNKDIEIIDAEKLKTIANLDEAL